MDGCMRKHALFPGAVAAAKALGAGLEEVLWPTRCVGCDAMGELLCGQCRSRLWEIDQAFACPRCGAPFGSLVCTECACRMYDGDDEDAGGAAPDQESLADVIASLDGVRSYAMLEWPHDRMVRAYKDAGERRLAVLIAQGMARAARAAWPQELALLDCVAFVPCTPQAYARRGFDHMEAVARGLAGLLGVRLDDVLARRSLKDQRDLGRLGRAANVRGTFAVLHRLDGQNILLVDDVFTTGATMGEAARALKVCGAARVFGLTFARAWAG